MRKNTHNTWHDVLHHPITVRVCYLVYLLAYLVWIHKARAHKSTCWSVVKLLEDLLQLLSKVLPDHLSGELIGVGPDLKTHIPSTKASQASLSR